MYVSTVRLLTDMGETDPHTPTHTCILAFVGDMRIPMCLSFRQFVLRVCLELNCQVVCLSKGDACHLQNDHQFPPIKAAISIAYMALSGSRHFTKCFSQSELFIPLQMATNYGGGHHFEDLQVQYVDFL